MTSTPSMAGVEAASPHSRAGTAGARAWLPFTLVVATALAVYANVLVNGLVADDQYQILANPLVGRLSRLPAIFTSGFWDFDGRVSSYYRPLVYVLYSLVHAVAGTAPWAYHLVSLLLHAATAALAFLVARTLLATDGAQRPWWRDPAFLVGLLFAVHPIHTEAVAWAAGVVDLLCSFFYLLAFYLVIRRGATYAGIVAGLAAYAAALLSKEPAITLPAVLLVYWWMRDGRALGVLGLVKRLTPWLVVSAAYLVVRRLVLGSVAPQVSGVTLSPWEYVLTAASLLGRFLRAETFPVQLNFWPVFDPVRTLLSLDAALAVLTIGIWAAILVWAVRRRQLAPVIALMFAVLPLTPALFLRSLNQGVENAFAERYLYLPSFGVVLFTGWVVASLEPTRARLARAVAMGLAGLAVVGAAVVVQRNPVWKDALSLWRDAAAKSPGSGPANLNYGFALMHAGQLEPGRLRVAQAVKLAPELVGREMRRAVGLARSRRSTDAILAFHNVLVMDPRSAEAHYNLGVLYEESGDSSSAVGEYERAIELDPSAANARNNLGILYFTAGDPARGLEQLQEAVRLRPDDAGFRANLERARSR